MKEINKSAFDRNMGQRETVVLKETGFIFVFIVNAINEAGKTECVSLTYSVFI